MLRGLAALCIIASSSSAAPILLFSLPSSLALNNASIVRVNPSGDLDSLFDTLLVDFWRVGNGPVLNTSGGWAAGDWTGAALPLSDQRGLAPLDVNGSTAIQFGLGAYGGIFGAQLNLYATPLQPGESLGTITVEQDFGPSTRVAPWAGGAGAALELSIFYQVPTAAKTGVAIYTSWTLGISHRLSHAFIWYETALFDLERPLGGDEVWLDTISGNVIIHGVLNEAAPSAFHTRAADSANSSSSCWDGLRRFHFTVDGSQVAGSIAAANAKFNLSLGADPTDWLLVHTNVEVESTGEGRAGHSLTDMRILWHQG